MIDTGAMKTNVVSFESEITLVRKIKNSTAIIQDTDLMLCAPFSLNRAFTGIHHAKYRHSSRILDVSFILTNSLFLSSSLVACYEQSSVPSETMLIIYDSRGMFHILDVARQALSCSFMLPDRPDHIISICGSAGLLNQFVVVTYCDVIVYRAGISVAQEIARFSICARRVLPFSNDFLLLSKEAIVLLNHSEGKVYPLYSGEEIDGFAISNMDIVVSRKDTSHSHGCSIFAKVNGQKKIGMKKAYEDLWDFANGWVVSLLKPDHLAIANINVPAARTVAKMNSQIETPKYVFAGIMSQENALGVIVFGGLKTETYQIPLDKLNELLESCTE